MSLPIERLGASLAAAFCIGLAACSTTQVKTAKDPMANFSKFRTYAWAPTTQGGGASPAHATVLEETVQADVDQELAKKGLKRVDPQQADLLVSYTAIARDTMTYGVMPGPGLWGPDYDVYPTRVGSLTLMFTDPKTHRMVWQGTASDTISEAGASQKEIGNAVKDLIHDFPKA